MAKWIDFKTVREHLDFRDVLSHYGLKPKGEGDQFKIVCPFHDDHKPSCGINRTKQVYNCFACDAGGNALDFVAHMEGLDPDKPIELRKAAMFAAETFGIDAALERPGNSKTDKQGAKGRAAKPSDKPQAKPKPVEQKSRTHTHPHVANDNGESASVETVKQGSEPATNKPIGFKLDPDPSHEFIEARGFDLELIKEFCIGYQNKGLMNGRICFPIHNVEGELIGYSGRWASDDLPEDVPRYLLPPKFRRNLELFNLHRVLEAKAQSPEIDTVVIVEGFWSVLRLHSAGIPVVSAFGDSVSEEQAELLVRHGFTNAILIFDGDEGGRIGTKSSLSILAERLFVKAIHLDDGVKPDTMDDELVSALPHYQ